jgi:hypothetical protein
MPYETGLSHFFTIACEDFPEFATNSLLFPQDLRVFGKI